MLIDDREFPGQNLRQGAYLERGIVSLWGEFQYVTTNPVNELFAPGYFNKLYQVAKAPDRIEVESFVNGEWRSHTLVVTGNTFDPSIPGIGGTVSVRMLGSDDEPMPEIVEGLRAVHKGNTVWEVHDSNGSIVAERMTKDAAFAMAMNGPGVGA